MTRCPVISSSSGGCSGSLVKLLRSTSDGLCLLTKRLERGHFARSSASNGKVFLTPAKLAMFLEGIDWRQPKRLPSSAILRVPIAGKILSSRLFFTRLA
ncbi:TPA: IS66 family insertion sequence element accessory protein TnpB [Enterobacter mori]